MPKAVIIGATVDIDGQPWDVREFRQTEHGFDLMLGWPSGCRGKGFGGPRIIPTPDLWDYFDAHRLDRDGSIYRLPAGRTAIKRIRRVLGFNLYDENEDWWLDRLDDLTALSGAEFASRHGVAESQVSEAHKRLVGRRTRQCGWYLEPEIRTLLAGTAPRTYIADRLGISLGAVGRLRWMVRQLGGEAMSDRPKGR